uniref:PUA_3 domain-containing protein n=1 Tax=Macrostomum lignano TaxID=282301 RepID=A0A1I8GHN1_9PLAT
NFCALLKLSVHPFAQVLQQAAESRHCQSRHLGAKIFHFANDGQGQRVHLSGGHFWMVCGQSLNQLKALALGLPVAGLHSRQRLLKRSVWIGHDSLDEGGPVWLGEGRSGRLRFRLGAGGFEAAGEAAAAAASGAALKLSVNVVIGLASVRPGQCVVAHGAPGALGVAVHPMLSVCRLEMASCSCGAS